MKESYWIYLLLTLGVFIIVVMMIVQNYTSTGEEDYYLTKEVMEAAMLDSIDYGVYAKYGDLRMIESKFVENFVRRFADSVNNSKDYTLEFYDIYEYPPKATVKVKTRTGSYNITADTSANFDILTTLSGIIETKFGSNHIYEVTMKVFNGKTEYTDKVASENGEVVFVLKPNEGYNTLKTVLCNGTNKNISVKGNTVTIKNIKEDLTCQASYEN